MSTIDKAPPDEFVQAAIAIAEAAGEVALRYFRTSLDASNKQATGFDPVTAADIDIEMMVRERLRRRFPTHRIIGEELPEDPGEADACWVVDPIDGTRGFLLGLPTWGILLGFLQAGRPALGLMYQPLTGDLFYGSAAGSFLRRSGVSTPIRCAPSRELAKATLCCTHPDMFAAPGDAQGFIALTKGVRSVRYGTDCWGYASLAMGGADLVFEADLKPCDVIPLIPIVEGAGGCIQAIDGGSAVGATKVVAATDKDLALAATDVFRGA